MHSLRQLIVLYARVPLQFWFFFQSFKKSELVFKSEQIKIRTFRWVKISQDCVIWNLGIDERTKTLCHTLDQFLLYIFSKKFRSAHKLLIKNILFRHICLLCNVNRLCNMYLIRRKKEIGQETDWTVITYVVVLRSLPFLAGWCFFGVSE